MLRRTLTLTRPTCWLRIEEGEEGEEEEEEEEEEEWAAAAKVVASLGSLRGSLFGRRLRNARHPMCMP